MFLVIVDTTKIQPYIFGSNRLRENVGASHLVAQATTTWAKEVVRRVALRNNIKSDGTLDGTKLIENPTDNLDAEVLYAGGGNFVVLFRTHKSAKVFTSELSRKVLTEAPNLQLVIVWDSFDWSESLSERIKVTLHKLANEKHSCIPSTPLLGLGVTAMCQSTGLPAVGIAPVMGDDPVRLASAEILAKLRVVDRKGEDISEADQRLRELLPPPEGYDYPLQLDHLGGTKSEHNFIAVVHVDGNGMGRRIMEIGEKYPAPSQNREYINALRDFSEQVDVAARRALQDVLYKLTNHIHKDGGNKIVHKNAIGKLIAEIELKSAGRGKRFLPFRPIVFGGDDVTFVCDGRLGVSLAIEYMRQLEYHTKNLPDGKGKLTSCAGVAIVKAHYPFARAYNLADELCKGAKSYRHEICDRYPDWDGSCLDWHFALSGLSGNIEEIRKREYRVRAGSLVLRPVTLQDNPKDSYRTWIVIEKGIVEFQGEDWASRRNKVKALRDALRAGPDAAKHFLTKYNGGRPLPDVMPSLINWKCEGWQGGYCGYFDALELADWFVHL